MLTHLDSQVLHEIHLKVDDLHGEAIGRELGGVEASEELLLLEDGDVIVADASQERGAGDRGWAAAQQSNLLPDKQSIRSAN